MNAPIVGFRSVVLAHEQRKFVFRLAWLRHHHYFLEVRLHRATVSLRLVERNPLQPVIPQLLQVVQLVLLFLMKIVQ